MVSDAESHSRTGGRRIGIAAADEPRPLGPCYRDANIFILVRYGERSRRKLRPRHVGL